MIPNTIPSPGVQSTSMQQAPASSLRKPTFSGMPVEVIGHCLGYLTHLDDRLKVGQVNKVCRATVQAMFSDFKESTEKGAAQFVKVKKNGKCKNKGSAMPADRPPQIKRLIERKVETKPVPEELPPGTPLQKLPANSMAMNIAKLWNGSRECRNM